MESTDVVVRRDGDVTVAAVLLRRVTGTAAAERMWQTLTALADGNDHGVLILDCGQMQSIASAGLARLVALAGHCRDSRTRLVLRNLCPSLRQVLHVLRLDVLLEIESDRPAAEGSAG